MALQQMSKIVQGGRSAGSNPGQKLDGLGVYGSHASRGRPIGGVEAGEGPEMAHRKFRWHLGDYRTVREDPDGACYCGA